MNDLVNRAFLFALSGHSGQTRKDGKPYIVHPFSVATILARDGASDELIAAGLLQDVIEDAGVPPERLRAEFGATVSRLVLFDTEDKSRSWTQRKSATIRALADADRACTMLVCADKPSDLCDIAADYRMIGASVWDRFRRGKEQQAWLYRACGAAFDRISDLKMYAEFQQMVDLVFQ